uniref:Uncharacterized protein n=1 Tax=Amphimedon queenslandica TaxID=400682 RepID=A0A1X7VBX7_AMPQE
MPRRISDIQVVHMCCKRLYSLSGVEDIEEILPDKTTEWRDSCAMTLMMTKKQLDENMVFLLSTLPYSDYQVLKAMFMKYEAGLIVKLSKKDKSCCSPECKGSHFRRLRNLEPDIASVMLKQVSEGTLPLQQLNEACYEVKKTRELKKKFVDMVWLSGWHEAEKVFPDFANEEKLTENCLTLTDFCQRALSDVLTDCHGFSLSIFEVASVEQIITSSRMTKAVNTAAGMGAYGIIFYLLMDFQLIANGISYLTKKYYFCLQCGFLQAFKGS